MWSLMAILLIISENVPAQSEMPDSLKEARNEQYKQQLESFLQDSIINGYDNRAAIAWNRDYMWYGCVYPQCGWEQKSMERYIESPRVKENRPITQATTSLSPGFSSRVESNCS